MIRLAELQLWEVVRELWLRSALAGLLLALNIADVITTQTLLGMGGIEANPLSAWLIEHQMLGPVKVLVVGFIAVAAQACSARRPVSAALGVATFIYAGVVSSNLIQIVNA